MAKKKVTIIGCGNIGLSLLQGFMKNGAVNPADITVTRRNTSEIDFLRDDGVNVTSDNVSAIGSEGIIIIAVKPYNFFSVLDELKDHIDHNRHTLVSVTAGVTIKQIEERISKEVKIYRAMPNISASVGKSVSCLSHNEKGRDVAEFIKGLFDFIGATMTIEEDLMESATILGACGVAFVLRFIRAMIQGGIQIGFDAATASVIVNHTVKGAAELLIERHQHPEYEIDKVTTPKGCTIVGLNEMEHNGFSSSLIKGIVASFEKIEK